MPRSNSRECGMRPVRSQHAAAKFTRWHGPASPRRLMRSISFEGRGPPRPRARPRLARPSSGGLSSPQRYLGRNAPRPSLPWPARHPRRLGAKFRGSRQTRGATKRSSSSWRHRRAAPAVEPSGQGCDQAQEALGGPSRGVDQFQTSSWISFAATPSARSILAGVDL